MRYLGEAHPPTWLAAGFHSAAQFSGRACRPSFVHIVFLGLEAVAGTLRARPSWVTLTFLPRYTLSSLIGGGSRTADEKGLGCRTARMLSDWSLLPVRGGVSFFGIYGAHHKLLLT